VNDPRQIAVNLPEIKVPAGLTFAGLAAGLALGLALSAAGSPLAGAAGAALAPIGALWLRALQMTILPLVASLLVIGVMQGVAAARAGTLARSTLALFALVLAGGTITAALLVPLMLDAVPVPAATLGTFAPSAAPAAAVPAAADFVRAIVPENIFAATAEGAVLPVIVFTALFAAAATRLEGALRETIFNLFAAIAGAMIVMVGWVLRLAPAGIFALAFTVASASGASVIAALLHYIGTVSLVGLAVLVAAYVLARISGLGGFARAVLPVQALALATQSSLACLPAMLAACRRIGIRPASAEFVLPLAVALFRATSPAMNLAVAIYVARLSGVAIGPAELAAGVAVALLTTLGSVSLPGTISFIASIGPICLVRGVPIAPLGLLVAVEMLPDIVRTVGNVTMNVAVAGTVDRRTSAT